MVVAKLSQFVVNIEYVPLETKDDFILDANYKCDFSDSLILVYNLNKCGLYNSSGKFITSIGTKGNGPGEFQFCMEACFSANNSIYLQSNLYDLLEFSLNGTLINNYKNIFRIDNSEDKFIINWGIISDSLLFGHIPNTTGQIEWKSILINLHGEIKKSWTNYDRFSRKGIDFAFESKSYNFYSEGSFYFKQFFNDTLFRLNERYELIPTYVFSLGTLKIPITLRAGRFGGDELWNFISLYDVSKTEKYLFLDCGFGNRFPVKRLTPHTVIQQAGETWYNTTNMLGIVDIETGKLVFCKPTSTDNPLVTTGIYNDIDGGPKFFPDQMINDSTMVMSVDSKELKDHVNSEDFKKSKSLYPEKKKGLEKLAARLKETDNPVLMLVRLKK